ncbi:Stk1 family PASTA domain-containing Ser/Thr kinase [Herbiconiux moechotypicola]|nr:Stk1 family PASTA domain-containing Ser/Thr kinase [Herbiconiux moechotypicola]MCS5730466.1 Stk1 family PASTA domain-containing Ser/Thr kinase [Herbiconiux moechotypicola]
MTSAPPDPMIGRLIDGRYRVTSRIARGGMATVYIAMDLRLERQVAIKIMHGHLADDAVFKERFVQEARSAARLAHPNVVNVFDQGQDSDMAYLVMEYLPGVTLRDLLKERRSLTTEQTIDVMDAVLGGLAAAHKAGIVHRDLKPENVLMADDGRIKISDFGLARAVSANTATGQALLGTIAYLSPELLTRGTADARSDIYAAGIMMYEMLVGAQPYVGEQPMAIAFQHANDQMPTPSAANASVPEQLDDLVLWATAKDPADRPTDAREMLDRLRDAEAEIVSTRPSATTGRTAVIPAAGFDAELDNAQTQVLESRRRTSAMTTVLNPNPPGTGQPGGPGVAGSGSGAAGSPPPASEGPFGPFGGTGDTTAFSTKLAPPAGGVKQASAKSKVVTKAAKRRRRGFWIAAIIVVVAALVGGAGWYFGAGPGAYTTVPTVAGAAPAEAEATLQGVGFTTRQVPTPSLDVAAGTVIGTDPPGESSAPNGSAIDVLVSTGPAMKAVPEGLAGMDEATAKATLEAVPFAVTDSQRRFDDGVAAGIVMAALGSDGNLLGTEYPEMQPVTLVVSMGAVPDVVGQTLEEAVATLQGVELVGAEGAHEFNDDIPEGQVYEAVRTTDPVHPGDTITLNISRGPEPVAIPSVVGLTWDEAKPQLEAAGFSLSYPPIGDIPGTGGLLKVTALSPDGGTSAPRGSTISVSLGL